MIQRFYVPFFKFSKGFTKICIQCKQNMQSKMCPKLYILSRLNIGADQNCFHLWQTKIKSLEEFQQSCELELDFRPQFYIVVLGIAFFRSFTFHIIFYLDFCFPFLFGLLFPFSIWTFISLFYFSILFQCLFNFFSILFFIPSRSHFGILPNFNLLYCFVFTEFSPTIKQDY